MANTTLSSIGGEVILGNWLDEEVVCMIADGTAKAGDMVGAHSTAATERKVQKTTSAGNLDEFIGIMLPQYGTDVDSAPGDGTVVNVVIPQSGHLYGAHTGDLGAVLAGEPLILGTSGVLAPATNIETEHCARLFKGEDDSTYNIVMWGG